ncbi:MAG: transposase, partial [Proteobacteria bacterium]|nr:transposase [Pseudomonadota bacterium]
MQASYPFAIDAIVVLPDHLHCIWTLPGGDVNFTSRWGLIKKEFTKHVRDVIGIDNMVRTAHPTDSMLRRRDAAIWQRRFWEHQIRDDDDFAAHCD